jgi:hypothetical protein
MSDRYYMQMAEKTKMAPWELQIALRDEDSPFRLQLEKSLMGKKVTRQDLVKELEELLNAELDPNTGKLPLLSLENTVKAVKTKTTVKVEIPNGRLKAPYIEALRAAIPYPLELDTATVKTMTTLLNALNKE